MKQGSRLLEIALKRQPGAKSGRVPQFLVELEPRHKVFFRNLSDLFWHPRQSPLKLVARPGEFWPDVFVASWLPWKRFGQSLLYHAVAIAALCGIARLGRPRLVDPPAVFSKADVIYYDASEYLAPLNTASLKTRIPQKADPVYAKQAIISVPADADNRTQTIVTPPKLKLNQEVALPNMVAWSQAAPTVPLAATESARQRIENPVLPAVVAPPPQMDPVASRNNPRMDDPAIVAPPPQFEADSRRKLGDLNIGRSDVVAPAPQLPVGEQRAMVSARQATLGEGSAAVVPPPPSAQSAGGSDTNGRMIALGIHPIAPGGPVEVPAGNRRGTFAATPEGKPGATGTPSVAGNSGSGAGSGSAAKGVPPGLFVGAGPSGSAVPGNGKASNDPRLTASATPPRVTSVPRRAASEVSDTATEIEQKVFGGRRFYSMTLSMPNLNSGGGSWVIHFAELDHGSVDHNSVDHSSVERGSLNHSTDKGELVAPAATEEVDPGYPLDLMRRNVHGTVTLYAVIQSDGSVGSVRVLNGVDDRLDQYACNALSRWKFLPATKNGNPVALEAVVKIPFRPLHSKGGF